MAKQKAVTDAQAAEVTQIATDFIKDETAALDLTGQPANIDVVLAPDITVEAVDGALVAQFVVTPERVNELAEKMYDAMFTEAQGKTWDGQRIKAWADLGESNGVRESWRAAAYAAYQVIMPQLGYGEATDEV